MPEVALDSSPIFILYKDGSVDRLMGNEVVPPSLDDPKVQSKDVVYSKETDLPARIYLPKTHQNRKLSVLIYIHGGGFVIETGFSPMYHYYLKQLAEEANVVVVSVHYRRAPEHPLPIAYDDAWEAMNWVASHSDGKGEDEWLNMYGDFGKVFLGGESAGANIAYNVGLRYGLNKLDEINLVGIVLVQPLFWGAEPLGDEADESFRRLLGTKSVMDKLWPLVCSDARGCDDPRYNPGSEPNLGKLGGSSVLVAVGEKDLLRERGWYFYESLKKSGWGGKLEIMEAKGDDHFFHFMNPGGENARALQQKFVEFLNQVKH